MLFNNRKPVKLTGRFREHFFGVQALFLMKLLIMTGVVTIKRYY